MASAFATADGLLCGVGDGVYANRLATGQLAWHVGSTFTDYGVIGCGGHFAVIHTEQPGIYGLDAGTGKTAWSFAAPYLNGMSPTSLAYADGRVYGWSWAGNGPGTKLIVFALDSRTGRLEWQAALSSSADLPGITTGGGVVYVSDPNQDGTGSELIALDAATGRHLWTTSGTTVPQAAGVAAGVVYGYTVGANSLVAAADAANGAPLWSHRAEWAFAASGSTMFVSMSSLVGLATISGDVLSLDIRTGQTLWQRNFPLRVPTVLAPAGSVLYAAERTGTLYALSARTGQELWRLSLPILEPQESELVYLMVAGSNVIAAKDGYIYAVQG
jgi:eukaryotic-like serine/threonine-protein kinase